VQRIPYGRNLGFLDWLGQSATSKMKEIPLSKGMAKDTETELIEEI
jgi:hypothetical protein